MPRKSKQIAPEFKELAKPGRLTAEEMKYIDDHIEETNEQIAIAIERTPNAIQRYRVKGHLVRKKKDSGQVALFVLEDKPYWKSLKYQFDNDELEVFKYEWTTFYVDQFKGDVMPTEELALVALITTNILLNRNMVEKKDLYMLGKKYKTDLLLEYKTDITDRDSNWIARVSLLENQLATIAANTKLTTDERTKLEGSRSAYLNGLKATREMRLKNSLEGSSNWPALLRAVEEQAFREREGRQAALINIAANKERDRLSQPFIFADGTIDLPILNSDTVKNLDEKEEKEHE